MIDFFDLACQMETNADNFGICDAPNNAAAYIDLEDSSNWIAQVSNPNQQNVTFTAIDNCIPILRADGNSERSCDGMLQYANDIIFVELKNVRKEWMSDGIEQLKRTIEVFSNQHELSNYHKKRAYLANTKHPKFQYSRKESMQRFRNETGVRLIIAAKIKL